MKKKILNYLKENRKKIIIVLVLLALCFALFFLLKKTIFKPKDKAMYSVAVVVRDRGEYEYGDVLLYKEGEDRVWSGTEKTSYLILKMDLTKEEAQQLTEGVNREMTKEEKEKEIEDFTAGREDQIEKEELDRFKEELDQRPVEVKNRKYRVEMEKEFEDFDPKDLYSGQPFQDEVFTWGIMEKK